MLVIVGAPSLASTQGTSVLPTGGQITGKPMPAKPVAVVVTPNVPSSIRQGGDTIKTATVIPSLPFTDTGTTAGYHDDYAGTCFNDNGAPDVVYRLEAPAGVTALDISLCGSAFDTGLYVLDASLVEIACNDDNCALQSHLEVVPCVLVLPPGGSHEGEPPLEDGYVDYWNGGCNTSPELPFQEIQGDGQGAFTLCGVAGWYLVDGSTYRDTDWFHIYAGTSGAVEILGDAEWETLFTYSWPHCSGGPVFPHFFAGSCREDGMTLHAPAGLQHWFVVMPMTFVTPPSADNEYDYVVWFSGLQPGGVQTESATWGALKALYR